MVLSTADSETTKLVSSSQSNPIPTPPPLASSQTNPSPAPPPDEKAEKKKKAPFLDRPIKVEVKNPPEVDKTILLKAMLKRANEGFSHWKTQSSKFKHANMAITVLVILLQIAQVVVIQIPTIATSNKTALGTIFPAITGGIVALQLKFSWAEKGTKCKKAAKLYSQLIKHLEFRLQMHEAGGITEDLDSVKVWNAALQSEIKDVPGFLTCC